MPETAPQRFVLLSTTRHLLPGAIFCGALVALLADGRGVRLAFAAGALLLLGIALLLRRRRPTLELDPEGYQVVVAGQRRFRVAWSEVKRVRVDRAEGALYVDCGDPARNLLLPPTRGYPFTFQDREVLFARVLASVPAALLDEVAALEPPAPAKS